MQFHNPERSILVGRNRFGEQFSWMSAVKKLNGANFYSLPRSGGSDLLYRWGVMEDRIPVTGTH